MTVNTVQTIRNLKSILTLAYCLNYLILELIDLTLLSFSTTSNCKLQSKDNHLVILTDNNIRVDTVQSPIHLNRRTSINSNYLNLRISNSSNRSNSNIWILEPLNLIRTLDSMSKAVVQAYKVPVVAIDRNNMIKRSGQLDIPRISRNDRHSWWKSRTDFMVVRCHGPVVPHLVAALLPPSDRVLIALV